MIVKARKKPVVISAVQYTGENFIELQEFVEAVFCNAKPDGTVEVYEYILGQWQVVPVGSFVIKGTKGEFYACSPEVFENIYDIIDESAADAAF